MQVLFFFFSSFPGALIFKRCAFTCANRACARPRVCVRGSYPGNPRRGAAGPWQRRSAPGRWRRRGAVWGRTSCYRRLRLHPAQASGSVSPDAAAWRDRGPIQVTASHRHTQGRDIFKKKKKKKVEGGKTHWLKWARIFKDFLNQSSKLCFQTYLCNEGHWYCLVVYLTI